MQSLLIPESPGFRRGEYVKSNPIYINKINNINNIKCIIKNNITHSIINIMKDEEVMSLEEVQKYIINSRNPYDYSIIEITGEKWEATLSLKQNKMIWEK